MTQADTAAVRKQVMADTPIEHNLLGAPLTETVFEPGPEGWPLYLDRYAALVKEGR